MTDHLSALPTELLYNVLLQFRGLFLDQPNIDANTLHTEALEYQPLYALAACSRHFEAIVESYCEYQLIKYKHFTRFKSESKKRKPPIPNRVRWVKWIASVCAFCGKKTICRAMFSEDLMCCKRCQRKRWDMVTMTVAQDQFNLSKLDLFVPNVLYDGTLAAQMPPLHIAVYDCYGVNTTMLLTDELKRRADFIHNSTDVADHRRRRKDRDRIMSLMKIHWHSPGRIWCPTWDEHWLEKLGQNEKSIRSLISNERAKIWKPSIGAPKVEELGKDAFYKSIHRFLLHSQYAKPL